eukprot:TRINITY_DN1848_c0_g1_i2.p3 TRINITY_DN1848_c0_g1~~TRINITY_DN1848_c0_g1_i2.p3  ORF type:complete len:140 (+),score=24.21 TRINITY_DN1848_c0_g1_i2:43-420(+)
MGEEVCSKCAKNFAGKKAGVTAFGRLWHKECFTCIDCENRLFSFSKFLDKKGSPQCMVCSKKESEAPKICSGCSGKIQDKVWTTFEGKFYHNACFKCDGCEKGLESNDVFEDSGKLWHLECFSKK